LAALKAGKGNDCACKNQVSSMGNSLIKDVPDPVVLSVSLTRQPCLHESKFCELNGETMEEEVSLKSKILTAMGMTEEAEVLALKAEIKDLDAKIEAMQNEFQKSLEALKANGSCSCKNISSMGNSLIKDVPDPVVLSVSLTKQPCLHESKFCELNGEIMEDEVSLKSKILTAIGMTEEAEVLALKAEIKDLDAKIEAMQNEFNKSLQALQEDFKQILTDALKPVEEEPAEEEAEPEKEEVAEKAETESTEEAEVEVEEEVEEVEADKAEEIVEEEPVAEKGESKQEPVHDNLEAQKSKPKSVYELMGRYPNGVKIRR
jgi:hypothetical protein